MMLLSYELRLAIRAGGGATWGLVFFALLLLLMPLVQPYDPSGIMVRDNFAGWVWLGAGLVALLSLERVWNGDVADGSLDLWALSPVPMELLAAVKALAHWLCSGLPVAVLGVIGGLAYGVEPTSCWQLGLSLLFGTPALSLIGVFCAALAVGRGGVLLGLIGMPLFVPSLILGAQCARDGFASLTAPVALLLAISLLSAAILPFATAAAIRLNR